MPVTRRPSVPAPKTPKQGRSPAYPGIGLRDAIEKAHALYRAEGKYATPMSSAFKAWGYGEKSSGGRQVRAALRYFGLISVEGEAETGKIKLTDDALRILLDEREDQSEKKAILRRLGLSPSIYQKLFDQYPDGLASDASVEHFLMFDQGYNKSAASEIVSLYKETSDYAGVYKTDGTPRADEGNLDEIEDSNTKIEIGDLVNIERDGVLVFPKPVRVREIQENGGQIWVWTDGADAWTEKETVELVSKGIGVARAAAPPPPPHDEVQKAHSRLEGSEREWLRGPLSKETSYRLIVTGDLGPKEIGKLIKLLKAQQSVLSDDDETDQD